MTHRESLKLLKELVREIENGGSPGFALFWHRIKVDRTCTVEYTFDFNPEDRFHLYHGILEQMAEEMIEVGARAVYTNEDGEEGVCCYKPPEEPNPES